MKRNLLILSLMSLGYFTGFSQITIEECYKKAKANYPLIKQYDLIEKAKSYNLANANKGYLPQITFSAKATYQSDVTKMPFSPAQFGIPGINIPTLSKDQYVATIDVNETIWDGGEIKSQKDIVRTEAEVNKKNTEVNIYSIYQKINQIYFGILLTNAQIDQNQLLQADLQRNYDQIQAYIRNGIAHEADLDAIKVEQLKALQNKIQFVNTKKAYIEMLSKFIGEELNTNTKFIEPEAIRPKIDTILRPELDLYNVQIKNYEAQNKKITTGLIPKLNVFITGAYGKPGLDMLKNQFSPYYIAGAKLTWNIGNFYTQKSNRKLIQNNIQSVSVQRQTFLFNTNLDITQKNNDIDNYLDQLKYDNEIIELRTSIKMASEAKMANGTISGTDLTRDINSEQLAKQDKILHEIELLLAIYNLKFVTNN